MRFGYKCKYLFCIVCFVQESLIHVCGIKDVIYTTSIQTIYEVDKYFNYISEMAGEDNLNLLFQYNSNILPIK